MTVHFSEEAEADLFTIGVWTAEHFGPKQMVTYHRLLVATCEEVIPVMHSHATAVPRRPGLWRWHCERHYIYFRIDDVGDFVVVRILHDSRPPLSHS